MKIETIMLLCELINNQLHRQAININNKKYLKEVVRFWEALTPSFKYQSTRHRNARHKFLDTLRT